jgi:hypothetical protein
MQAMGPQPSSNPLHSSSGGGRRDYPSGPQSLHNSGSFSKWEGNRSTGVERDTRETLHGSRGGGSFGGRSWSNTSNSPANVYGPDGLGPANKRIEEVFLVSFVFLVRLFSREFVFLRIFSCGCFLSVLL